MIYKPIFSIVGDFPKAQERLGDPQTHPYWILLGSIYKYCRISCFMWEEEKSRMGTGGFYPGFIQTAVKSPI